jgi:hypothetical protein
MAAIGHVISILQCPNRDEDLPRAGSIFGTVIWTACRSACGLIGYALCLGLSHQLLSRVVLLKLHSPIYGPTHASCAVADVINKLADADNDTATWNHDFPGLSQKRHRKTGGA